MHCEGPTQIDNRYSNTAIGKIPMICRCCNSEFKAGTIFEFKEQEKKLKCPNCKIWSKY